jgi:hypothetical protein
MRKEEQKNVEHDGNPMNQGILGLRHCRSWLPRHSQESLPTVQLCDLPGVGDLNIKLTTRKITSLVVRPMGSCHWQGHSLSSNCSNVLVMSPILC